MKDGRRSHIVISSIVDPVTLWDVNTRQEVCKASKIPYSCCMYYLKNYGGGDLIAIIGHSLVIWKASSNENILYINLMESCLYNSLILVQFDGQNFLVSGNQLGNLEILKLK